MKQAKTFRYGYGELSLFAANIKAMPIEKAINTNKKELNCVGNYALTQDKNGLTVYKTSEKAYVIPTGELYLVFNKKIKTKKYPAILKELNLHITDVIEQGEYMVATDENPINRTIQLQKDKRFKIVEPELIAAMKPYSFPLPTDELLAKQWYIDNTGKDPYGKEQHWKYKKGADARVLEAWKILWEKTGKIGSSDITVAVIDKGFDINHPDYKDKIVAARDFHHENNSSIPHAFAITQSDVDSQGKIDTEADHGTSCAGIAIASANGSGIVGAAPNAKFMPIRYYVANGRYFREMFRHIMRHGGDVISCSFGNVGIPMDRLTIKMIHKCATEGRNGKGCVILFATGNAFDMLKENELATHPDIIAVGASTSEDTFAAYTNRTKNMSVCAPGGYGHSGTMTTSDVGYLDSLRNGQKVQAGKGRENNPYYRHNAEGTSFACPLVAGVAALVLSANPNLTAAQVKKILEETADKIGTPSEYDDRGHSVKFGYGRVNAANAVRKAFGMPTIPHKVSPPDVSNIPTYTFDYGTSTKGTHGPNDEEVVLQYPVHPDDAGKTLMVELDVPLEHDSTKHFELYVQHGRKPVFFPEDFIDKKLGETVILTVQNIKAGTYFFMLRCLDTKEFEFVKGGGDFELNFTLLPPMA